MNSLIAFAIVITLGMRITTAQKTFMRSCDCEHTTDGKCAYTLLLPLTSATCDSAQTTRGDQSTTQWAHAVQNISKLADWVADQSRLLSQLQGSVLSLQKSISAAPLAPNTNNVSVVAALAQHSADIATLQYNINNIHRVVSMFTDTVISLNKSVSGVTQKVGVLPTTGRPQTNIGEMLNGLISDVDRLTKATDQLCSNRGLLVSGSVVRIPDAQINVSSSYNSGHGRNKARITTTGSPGSWCPAEPNHEEEWIQFDLGRERVIYDVVTKGRADYNQWVTSYKVLYSNDITASDAWTSYKNVLGEVQIFEGNDERDTLKTNTLWSPLRARFVRIVPLAAYRDNNRCMRADLIGCVDT